MKRAKKILSVLLLAALALTSVPACSESQNAADPEEETTSAVVQEQEPNAEAEAETEENDYYPDGIPDSDFGGVKVQFICPTWYNAPSFIYASELNGEVVNDAFYNQRMEVQERFNVSVEMEIYPDEGGGTKVEQNIHQMVAAGDDSYDLVYNGDGCGVRNGLGGDFLNLRSIPTIDFDKPWFKGTTDLFTVGGKLFFTANTLSISSIYMNSILAVNKDVAADFGLTVPYDKARAGTWVFDDLIAMTADMNQDLNGDGQMNEDDQYGFLTQYYSELCVQCNLGGATIGKNADGWLDFVADNERIVSIMEKYAKLMENGNSKLGASNEGGADTFIRGHSLFCFLEGRVLSTKVRDSDITYGVLPFPKYDENQQDYSSAGYDLYWGIPLTSNNADITGTLVCAMSCYNYNKVVPLVWEVVLGSKLSDAPDDADMFRIIRDVQYVDIGYACSCSMSAFTDFIFLLNKTEPGQVISFMEKRLKPLRKSIERMNNTFAELGS